MATTQVNTKQIEDESVTAAKVTSGGASDGDVLTADGSGGAAWETPSGGGGGGAALTNYEDRVTAISGLVGYWRLNEPSGTTAADSSTNSNDGTYINSPSLGETGPLRDVSSNAMFFDGNTAPDDGMHVGTDPDYTFNPDADEFTVSLWFKFGTDSVGMILVGSEFEYRIETTTVGSGIRIFLFSDALNMSANESGIDALDGEWHHIAVLFAGSGVVSLFIDGLFDASDSESSTGSNSGFDLCVGGSFNNSTMSLSGSADGTVAELCLFSRQLTRGEIANLATPFSDSVGDAMFYLNDIALIIATS